MLDKNNTKKGQVKTASSKGKLNELKKIVNLQYNYSESHVLVTYVFWAHFPFAGSSDVI
ncbi:hypothetical protein LINPERHAP2_LOCUS32505, partial [Linum perenne]